MLTDKKIKAIQQKLFNKAYKGLAKQNWVKSLSDEGRQSLCAYRGENNCKCFVGHLIPNNFYNINLEGHTIFTERVRNAIPELIALTDENQFSFIPFLIVAQYAHDYSQDEDDMKERLCAVATNYGLTIPELN